jgi:predicted nuclease of predicted toxin-antitoxin system
MKILLDECITKKLKPFLIDNEVFTVVEMGWSGLKNGELLAKCSENNFDILLTIDKNITNQQSIKKFNVAVVVLNCSNSKIESITPFIPKFNKIIEHFSKGNYFVIDN